MKLVILWIFAVLFAVALQSTVIPYLSLAGVYPDLVTAVIMVIALWHGRFAGIWAGFFTGLLLDSWAPNQLGLQSLGLVFGGVFVGLFDSRRMNSGPAAQFFLFILGSAVHDLVIYIAVGMHETSIASFLFGQMVPRALFTALFGMGIVFLGRQVNPYGRR